MAKKAIETPSHRAPARPLAVAPQGAPPKSLSVPARFGLVQRSGAAADDPSELEHRRFPRAAVSVPFDLSVASAEGEPRFSARLRSVNLSVSGAFLESTFFLPVGTRLHAIFRIDESGPAVEADAEIVRHEHPDERAGRTRSGFAIRFLDFFGRTEVTLAKLFVGEQLRAFAMDYLQSPRARGLTNELDRVVDALAAWELQKVISNSDLWSP